MLSWRLLPFGVWRRAWSAFRRPAAPTISASAAARMFHPLPPERPYCRRTPRIENARPEFVGALDYLCATPVQPPTSGLAEMDKICTLASGLLLTRTGEIIAESLVNREDAPPGAPFRRLADDVLALLAWPWTRIAFQRGDHVFLKQFFDGNYGHWLIDMLPRIAIAGQFVDLSRCRIVVSRQKGGMSRVYRESLALFGIEPEQIVEVGRRPALFERLYYPLPNSQHPWVKSPRAIEWLGTLPEKVGARRDGPKRLYVTRNRDKNRRLTNEDEILAILRPYGFVSVEPGRMSFADQLRIFAGAELIIGNCGAGLTNLVFAPRGVGVFALTTPFMQDDFFWDLTDLKQGRFFSLHGVAAHPARGAKSDFSIDLATFKAMLAEFLADAV